MGLQGIDAPQVLRYPAGTRVDPDTGLMSRITYPDQNFDYFETLYHSSTPQEIALLPDLAYVTLFTFRGPDDERAENAFFDTIGNVAIGPSVKIGKASYKAVKDVKRQLERTEDELAAKISFSDYMNRRKLRRDYNRESGRTERDRKYSFYAALLNAPLIIETVPVQEAIDFVDGLLAKPEDEEFIGAHIKWGNANERLREIYERHSGLTPLEETG